LKQYRTFTATFTIRASQSTHKKPLTCHLSPAGRRYNVCGWPMVWAKTYCS